MYNRELGNDQQHQSQQLFFPSRYVCGYNILKMKTDNVAIILTSWLVLFGWFLGKMKCIHFSALERTVSNSLCDARF